MASCLFGRYSRLLCKVSSQVTAVTRLPLPVASPAEVLRAQGWPWVTDRLMCDTKRLTKNNNYHPTRTLTQQDQHVATPEEILLAWKEHKGNGNEAANALIKLALLGRQKKANFKELLNDSRLQNMMDTLSQRTQSVSHTNLVSALQALWIMDLPHTHSVLNSVQTEVLWRLRKLHYKQLGYLVAQGIHREGYQNVTLMTMALKQLELRWIEICDVKTVTVLISKGQHISPTLRNRLEDKALELAESFSSEQIRKLCVSLATQNRRCVPLLRALSHHLLQKPLTEFTTPLMLDLAFAFGKLNFKQHELFHQMSTYLTPRVPQMATPQIIRCAKSLSYLKWLDIPLLEAFTANFIENSKKYSIFQIANLVLSFAKLDFRPSKGEEFFGKVHSMMDESLSDLSPILLTDMVWSLCVLQQAKPQYLIPFTQQNHITKLSEDSEAKVMNYQLKLLHIAATLHLEHRGCSDSKIPSSLIATSDQASISPLQSSLRETLHVLVDGRTEALRTMVDTVFGWTIDGELVLNCDSKPMDMSMLKALHLPSGGGNQALPVGSHRIAFLAWEYPNFCFKTKDLMGQFSMKKRHLKLAGFITVEVPYYEWLELKTDRQKLTYLRDKMGKAVAEEMAK